MDRKIKFAKELGLYLFTSAAIGFSLYVLWQREAWPLVILMSSVVGLLIFFSSLGWFLRWKGVALAEEIIVRTRTWWIMIAIMMLGLSVNRVLSFIFLSLLSFLALREFFGLMPKIAAETHDSSRQDKVVMIICYLAILLNAYFAYTQWYALYIIIVPVYIFLLIPIVFVLQNRTKGAIRSLGLFSLGVMFFAFSLGHSLFMINMGAMVLFFTFALTELRDMLAFWVGKGISKAAEKKPDASLSRLFLKKIAPDINSRKTWSAGLLTAVLTSLLAVAILPFMPVFPNGAMSPAFIMGLGLLIGILGLMGDLVFGMVKRDIGIKDTGSVLPGHGGFIDRVNSLVFTIPITFHLINWIYF